LYSKIYNSEKRMIINSQERFCAHFRSSALGLQPMAFSIITSKMYQKWSFSKGQFNHPVVMQKYVSCGATWCTRWCFLGKIILCSWSQMTQVGNPKYVCDHLCIYKTYIIFNHFLITLHIKYTYNKVYIILHITISCECRSLQKKLKNISLKVDSTKTIKYMLLKCC